MRRARFGCLGVLLAAATAHAEAPRWPLDLPPVLTSSFGEFRSGRLHAGIDLGSGGKIGAACHATGDGSVVRMRMGPFGYGKALYIQMDGGPLVVYAHLSRFAAPMAARARAEQGRLRRYSFDIQIPAGEMRVRRDDVVAWSGQTGVGVPHLHFELRDGDVARNPQTAGFPAPDTIAPVIGEVAVTPITSLSHVAGGLETRKLPQDGAPLVVGGRIGFSVRAWDHATSREYRQAPYRYELRVDGKTLFRLVHERFDYDTNHLLVLEYDQERLLAKDERVQLLYARPGDRILGRETPSGNDGCLVATAAAAIHLRGEASEGVTFAAGPHDVEVEVADAAGHVTLRRARIVLDAPPTIEIAATHDAGRLAWEARARDADVGDALAANVAVSRDGGAHWDSLASTLDAGFGVAPDAELRAWRGDAPWDGHGAVALRARVRDRAGQMAEATWSPSDGVALASCKFVVRPVWRPRWVELEIASDAKLGWNLPRLVWQGTTSGEVPLRGVGAGRYRAAVPLAAVGARLGVRRGAEWSDVALPGRARFVAAGAAARLDSLDPDLVVDVPAGALLEDVALRAERVAAAKLGALGPELRVAGPCVAVEPRTAALDKPLKIALRAPGAPGIAKTRVGLFWVNRSGDLRFLSAERDTDGRLVAETRSLSRFVALADTTPPWIGALSVQPRGDRPQWLVFAVRDDGADLGDGGVTAELDGDFAVPEWDPETGEVVVEPDTRLGRGAHQLRVAVTDQLGNRRARVLKFTIP